MDQRPDTLARTAVEELAGLTDPDECRVGTQLPPVAHVGHIRGVVVLHTRRPAYPRAQDALEVVTG